ncbi:MAG: hypothetical protein K0V04_11470 [Deltaproteobacteria bacterium]|nr:hypothetical protein [Deltaproteobacteria bacterium]
MMIVALGWGQSLACTQVVINEDHCAFLNGDATCQQRHGAALPFCERGACSGATTGDGCVAERPQPDECYSPCGGQSSFPDDSSCLDGGTDSVDGGTTTRTSSTGATDSAADDTGTTSGVDPCGDDNDCRGGATPFCGQAGVCVPCSAVEEPDAACGDANPDLPLCIDGQCVQCSPRNPASCAGVTPVCDAATSMCVPCREHMQCEPAACNFFTGACLPAAEVAHVGPGQPFVTLADAVSSISAGGQATLIVHEGVYAESVSVDGGRTVAVRVSPGESPTWVGPGVGEGPQLVVTEGTVIIDEQQLSGNGSSSTPAVVVDGGLLWADRTRIIGNVGGALAADAGAEVVLRNGFFGGDINDVTAIDVVQSSVTIVYSTLGAGFGAATALDCDVTAVVDVRNSLLVARTTDPEVACGFATIETSVSEAELGGTNVGLGEMSVAWFEDYAAGDLHLASPPAAVIDAALWQQGDPEIDIDGEPRPDIDGARDAAGADVP